MVHRLTGIPFIYHIHNVYVDYGLNRQVLPRAAAIVANSFDMTKDFIEHVGEAMECIQVVYNGLDPDIFKPDIPSTIPSEFKLNEDTIIIGIASRLAPDKGQETFLRAAALVASVKHNVHFLLAGDDSIFSDNKDYVPFLHKLTEDMGLNDRVHFLGYRSDMVNVYSGFDIVVNTAWREAFGMVVVEPMACGRAVVGPRSGGIPEIIRDGENGFLFPPRDHKKLAKILLDLLENPALIKKVGNEARKTIMERFTIKKQTETVEKIYKQVALKGKIKH